MSAGERRIVKVMLKCNRAQQAPGRGSRAETGAVP
jgi:hypothetical protein